MGLREKKKEKRRELILKEFDALLSEHGLDGFTLKDISDNLEISLRTLYNYYQNKEDLISDYLGNKVKSHLEEVEKLGMLVGEDFCEDMHILISWFLKIFFSDKNLKKAWIRDFLAKMKSGSIERANEHEKIANGFITLIYRVVCMHNDKLKHSSFLIAEIFIAIFKDIFIKIAKGSLDFEQALEELEKKIVIVYEGVGK